MPTRNTRKLYTSHTYYHVYSRGVDKQPIFHEPQDYNTLLGYFERHLTSLPMKKSNGQIAQSYADEIDLLCYCLMTNHIHLLLYQRDDDRAMSALLQRVLTSYSMYFNKKYGRIGPVFQSRYLASPIDRDDYLHHITRYIHRNPKLWSEYEFSSLPYYRGEKSADWIKPNAILELFDNNAKTYMSFVQDMDEDDEETVIDLIANS